MNDVSSLFRDAVKREAPQSRYLTRKEWERPDPLETWDNTKKLKRLALGLCGIEAIKSLDEMARLLQQTGVVSSIEEGRKQVPKLVGGCSYYKNRTFLTFDEVFNKEGDIKYRVKVETEYDSRYD
ncbi:MAG TPA: hypothetical protein VJK51_04315 [Candidatus Nanoarchaeia archaeon]|nr:hypothetical protein [Candidatus Nanoarchaeia archaeon]